MTSEGHFKYYKRFHCLYLKMYEAKYNGRRRTSYVNNHFYCHIRLLRDLLVIDKFLVIFIIQAAIHLLVLEAQLLIGCGRFWQAGPS